MPKEVPAMRDEYDFSHAKRNPYADRLKKQITMNMDVDTIEYFKALSKQNGIPYQVLINMYLRECVENNKQLKTSWE